MDWTVEQATSNLKVSEKTVRRWVSTDKVEYERRDGKYGSEIHITAIPDELMARQPLPNKTQRAEMAVQTFADILREKDQKIAELNQTLGAARLRVGQLENEVKLLQAPSPVQRVHWWQRLWRVR